MAQVDFYVLRTPGEQARRVFACRLAEKAYRLENTVHILAPTRDDAAELDTLLWTFRDGSFVPHRIAGSQQPPAPVTVGDTDSGIDDCDLLINLAADIPAEPGRFPRIAELVSSDDDGRRQGRARFAAYRDQGHDLNTHNL